jgi:hypothetical protein
VVVGETLIVGTVAARQGEVVVGDGCGHLEVLEMETRLDVSGLVDRGECRGGQDALVWTRTPIMSTCIEQTRCTETVDSATDHLWRLKIPKRLNYSDASDIADVKTCSEGGHGSIMVIPYFSKDNNA